MFRSVLCLFVSFCLVGCAAPKNTTGNSATVEIPAPKVHETADTEPSKDGRTRLDYHVELLSPASHDLRVDILVTNPGQGSLYFVMPNWAPNRLCRDDFARNVFDVQAKIQGGHDLPVERIDFNRWRVPAQGRSLLFQYKTHAARLSSGTSLYDDQGAVLNGASIFMAIDNHRDLPVTIYIDRPQNASWASFSGLRRGDAPDRFQARNFRDLAGASILVGDFSEHRFKVGKQEVEVLVSPRTGAMADQLALDLKKLIAAATTLFGPRPTIDTLRLHFVFGVSQGINDQGLMSGSGLLLRRSPLSATELRPSLQAAAGLIARSWFAKTLVTKEWRDVNFVTTYLSSMAWFGPSLGDYFAKHLSYRAGLLTKTELTHHLGEFVAAFEEHPAADRISLTEAAKLMGFSTANNPRFAPSNAGNVRFEARRKGRCALFLLDLQIRATSAGDKGLVDLLSILAERPEGLSSKTFLAACEKLSGRRLRHLTDSLLNDRKQPPYQAIATAAGFRLSPIQDGGSAIGATFKGATIVNVLPKTPAARAGLQKKDRVARFDGKKVGLDLSKRIAKLGAGSRTTITVERRGRLLTLPLVIEARKMRGHRFQASDSNEHAAARKAFFGSTETP